MAWDVSNLHTRVAKRIVVLFLLSALAPLSAFAALSWWMVGAELQRQSQERLRFDAKSAAMAIVERLWHVEARLRITADTLVSAPAGSDARVPSSLNESFRAVTFVERSGVQRPLFGDERAPRLTAAQEAHVAAGQAVVIVDAPEDGSRVSLWMALSVERSGQHAGLLVAHLNERVIWDLGEDATRPPGVEVCVLNERSTALACSTGRARTEPWAARIGSVRGGSGSLVWQTSDRPLAGAYWSAPLARQFAVPQWTIVLTREAEDAQAAATWFKRAFTIISALTLALIAGVSLSQIRRGLQPLERLREGALLLQGGDFTARVSVTSGDEFESLAESFNLMASEIQRQFAELKALNVGTIEAFARAIDAKSPWTAGHSQRVTALGVQIAREMRLPARAIDRLHYAGLLHDIGKIGVPGRILDKAGPLTQDEFALMKQHPELGARILEPIPQFADVIPVVLEHHERFDGAGYPQGLAGEGISLGGRIFAVADVFDAMSSDRPYRPACAREQVLGYITQQAGRHFDPQVVDAFLRVMSGGGRDEVAPAVVDDPVSTVKRLAS